MEPRFLWKLCTYRATLEWTNKPISGELFSSPPQPSSVSSLPQKLFSSLSPSLLSLSLSETLESFDSKLWDVRQAWSAVTQGLRSQELPGSQRAGSLKTHKLFRNQGLLSARSDIFFLIQIWSPLAPSTPRCTHPLQTEL